MKTFVAAVCILLTARAMGDQTCQAPKSESVSYLTSIMQDIYVANDFEQGKVLIVLGDNGFGNIWCLVDTVSGRTYVTTPEGGCKYTVYPDELNAFYSQCLPATAKLQRSGLVDFYYMDSPVLNWLVGMKPVEGTEYYYRHFSRYFLEGVVETEITYAVNYKFSLGISDPKVFEKDLSVCSEGVLDKPSV